MPENVRVALRSTPGFDPIGVDVLFKSRRIVEGLGTASAGSYQESVWLYTAPELHEEKYCEIAAKRMAQEVLQFQGD